MPLPSGNSRSTRINLNGSTLCTPSRSGPIWRRAVSRSPASVIVSASLKLSRTTRVRKLRATGLSSTMSTLTDILLSPLPVCGADGSAVRRPHTSGRTPRASLVDHHQLAAHLPAAHARESLRQIDHRLDETLRIPLGELLQCLGIRSRFTPREVAPEDADDRRALEQRQVEG